MIAAYLRTLNHDKAADRLLANMDQAIDFLKRNNYTNADMTSHQWVTVKDGFYSYGKMTDGLLRNTNGVMIWPDGGVTICHFDHRGMPTKPMIDCSAGKFTICE